MRVPHRSGSDLVIDELTITPIAGTPPGWRCVVDGRMDVGPEGEQRVSLGWGSAHAPNLFVEELLHHAREIEVGAEPDWRFDARNAPASWRVAFDLELLAARLCFRVEGTPAQALRRWLPAGSLTLPSSTLSFAAPVLMSLDLRGGMIAGPRNPGRARRSVLRAGIILDGVTDRSLWMILHEIADRIRWNDVATPIF